MKTLIETTTGTISKQMILDNIWADIMYDRDLLEQRNKIRLKLIYAKDFTPHKISYYEEMLKEFDKNILILIAKLKY